MAAKPKKHTPPPSTDIRLKSLAAHVLCDTVPGGMSAEEHAALIEDLRVNGMRIPIVLYQGKILDGRERYRAAQAAGVPIKHEEFTGDDDAARHYVMSTNLQRRTLTGMQKSLAVAELYKREVNKGGQYPSQDVLAKRYGVSKQTISLCCKALDSKNTMLITRMRRGEVTRGELDEEFYDRDAGAVPTTGGPAEAMDIFGAAPPPNVHQLFPPGSATGGKASADTTRTPSLSAGARNLKKTKDTPASVAVQHFKALSDKDRADFVRMAWPWLESHVVAHQSVQKAMTSSAPDAKPKRKAKAA